VRDVEGRPPNFIFASTLSHAALLLLFWLHFLGFSLLPKCPPLPFCVLRYSFLRSPLLRHSNTISTLCSLHPLVFRFYILLRKSVFFFMTCDTSFTDFLVSCFHSELLSLSPLGKASHWPISFLIFPKWQAFYLTVLSPCE